jgi:hypothetical protein
MHCQVETHGDVGAAACALTEQSIVLLSDTGPMPDRMLARKISRTLGATATLAACALLAAPARAAPPLRPGPHPRIWLDARTMAAMRASLGDPASGAARAVALCSSAAAQPREAERSGYQGQTWARYASSCGLAYQLTGDRTAAEVGARMLAALIDDERVIGDGKGGDGVVRHDSGYGVRFIGAHAALAYDYLHEAPSTPPALLARARSRFKAWMDWYARSGYLPTTPGANYEAGFLFAKTLTAIASAGELPEAEHYWAEVVDGMLRRDVIERGLQGGPLEGGDWPEGWQYGALSVLEYALVTRAVEQQGVALPELHAWAGALVARYAYALTPDGKGTFVGGDTEVERPFLTPPTRPLLAGMVLADDRAASWAAFLRDRPGVEGTAGHGSRRDDFPLYDALAEARGATPIDPFPQLTSPTLLARGTRTLYVREGSGPSALWAVFRSAPQLVPDHQRKDASGFVLARGSDPLVVDPSPYGARSTLMGNALAIDSAVVPPSYSPTQMFDGKAELVRARTTRGGVVAARADIKGAFVFKGQSDVDLARRDWVMFPDGYIVVVDRARTGGPALGAHVRFRSVAPLALEAGAGGGAAAVLGASRLVIRPAFLSGGTPEVRRPPVVRDPGGPPYNGDGARFAVSEYRVAVPGPAPLAVHVLLALGSSEAVPQVDALGAPGAAASDTRGPVGAVIRGAGSAAVVVATGRGDGEAPQELRYDAPGEHPSRHVVLDVPSGEGVAVTATATGHRCSVRVGAGSGEPSLASAPPLVFLLSDAASGCRVTEDPPLGAATSLLRAAPDDGAARGKLERALLRVGRRRLALGALALTAVAAGMAAAIVSLVRRRSAAGA